MVSTHSRPKAAGPIIWIFQEFLKVSTHSRPKAAGIRKRPSADDGRSFNTQPPEGGWRLSCGRRPWRACFNTQPPEGGWIFQISTMKPNTMFQHTAARRRLGSQGNALGSSTTVSTHSRPKAAGRITVINEQKHFVSTHSRPKAAGSDGAGGVYEFEVSTHSRPKAAGNKVFSDRNI